MPQATQPKLWVVLADGAHAHILAPGAVEGRFSSVAEITAPGYTHAHGGHDASHNLARADKGEFARDLAHRLDDGVRAHSFDQLVLIAPAHVLHDVREALGAHTAKAIVGTESKDLVKLPILDRDKHLARWWLAPAAV